MSYEEENVKKLCLKIQLPLITKSLHTELCVMCTPIIPEWKRLRKGDCKLCPNMGHLARDRNKSQIWTSTVAEQIKALTYRQAWDPYGKMERGNSWKLSSDFHRHAVARVPTHK